MHSDGVQHRMNSADTWHKIKSQLNGSGFNIAVRIDASQYDSIVPEKKRAGTLLNEARSIILTGFAGNKFWPVLQSFLRQNPQFKNRNENIIDNYSRITIERVAETLTQQVGAVFKIAYPFGQSAYDLDFTLLGIMGGVGVPSLLGMLLHPEYGTWMSLRGALLTDMELSEYDKPISEFNPCPSCEKPCIEACPADTVTEKGWDWRSCMDFRLSSDICSAGCASRKACPYGQYYMYSDEQIEYHHQFVLKSVKAYSKAKSF